MTRTHFSLDGAWAFWPAAEDGKLHDPSASLPTTRAPYSVQVPGNWQAVDELRFHQGIGWYQTEFDAPELAAKQRLFIHFGAVDWSADVWVNGTHVGEHANGWLPFEVDATAALRTGRNVLTVRVADPVELFHALPHGKQSWYGLLSGIWQPVYAEVRNAQAISSARILTSAAAANVSVALNSPLQAGQTLSWILSAPDGAVHDAGVATTLDFAIDVADPVLWDIGAGNLYTLDLALLGADGATLDRIIEQFGFRTISTQDGKVLLNGKPFYMRGALDQDYYPDTGSVAPSQEFIEDQFRLALDLGFNSMRVHIKVADPRYYAAADKVGILIWTEIPNWQTFSATAAQRGEETMYGMVARDWNHPSIHIRTVINESWGIDLTVPEQREWLAATVQKLRDADPSRLVVGNSACHSNFHVDTDIEDFHMYMAMPDRHRLWRKWTENYASRPQWTFAHEYTTFEEWKRFLRNTMEFEGTPAAENIRRGDEPLNVSEFGNWGLPDLDLLLSGYGGEEPWWFEQGSEWGNGEVYPHGIEHRFNYYSLQRAFPSLAALTAASRYNQGEAMKFEIEQIRKHAPIQGYIVTEWSDVNWECNGMVDMRRNPKPELIAMHGVNQDTALVPEWERLAWSAGETVRVPILVSHYGAALADGCELAWTLEGTDLSGIVSAATPVASDVVEAGVIEVELPLVNRITRARLHVRLLDNTEREVATTYLDLIICPEEKTPYSGALASPDIADALGSAGYDVKEEGDIIVTAKVTDELRQYMLDGGRVLLLAESADALQTRAGNLHIIARDGTPWQGDWASSGLWIAQDKCFDGVSANGMMDFTFADLAPRHVIGGVAPVDYLTRVHAGLYVGWVHKGIPTVVEARVGRGVLLISTLRLLPNLEGNPLARVLLAQMVNYLANLKHVY